MQGLALLSWSGDVLVVLWCFFGGALVLILRCPYAVWVVWFNLAGALVLFWW